MEPKAPHADLQHEIAILDKNKLTIGEQYNALENFIDIWETTRIKATTCIWMILKDCRKYQLYYKHKVKRSNILIDGTKLIKNLNLKNNLEKYIFISCCCPGFTLDAG